MSQGLHTEYLESKISEKKIAGFHTDIPQIIDGMKEALYAVPFNTREIMYISPFGNPIRLTNTLRIFIHHETKCAKCGDIPDVVMETRNYRAHKNFPYLLHFLKTKTHRGKTLYKKFTSDHIMPKSKGGCSSLWNRQILCSYCNYNKAADIEGDIVKKYRIGDVKDHLKSAYDGTVEYQKFYDHYVKIMRQYHEDRIPLIHQLGYFLREEMLQYLDFVASEFGLVLSIDDMPQHQFLA